MASDTSQPLDTVNWTGDGDDADFFVSLERDFQIRFPAHLPFDNFGDVHDHVAARLDLDGAQCATQMSFYRLRAALGLGRDVRPDEPAAPHFAKRVEWQARDLAAAMDLDLPDPQRGPLFWLALLIYLAAIVALFALDGKVGALATAFGLAFVAMWIQAFDRKRWPREIATLGDWARLIAERNRGRLARQGARLTEADVWREIQRRAAEERGTDPDRIARATRFYR